MKKLPYMQLFTGDWKKDPALSRCSPATRGLWIDACAAMHDARSGSLSGSPEDLSRLLRCSPADVLAANAELKTTGTADVTERNGVITWTCRRIKRELNALTSNADRQRTYRDNHRELHNSNAPPSVSPPIPPSIPPTPEPAVSVSVVEDLKTRISSLYRGNRRWSYEEESVLAEMSRHEGVLGEFNRILLYREGLPPKDRARYFPQSVRRLLDQWNELLDRAQITAPGPGAQAKAVDQLLNEEQKL